MADKRHLSWNILKWYLIWNIQWQNMFTINFYQWHKWVDMITIHLRLWSQCSVSAHTKGWPVYRIIPIKRLPVPMFLSIIITILLLNSVISYTLARSRILTKILSAILDWVILLHSGFIYRHRLILDTTLLTNIIGALFIAITWFYSN